MSAKQGVVQLHFKLIFFLIKIVNKLYPAFHLHRDKRKKKRGGGHLEPFNKRLCLLWDRLPLD